MADRADRRGRFRRLSRASSPVAGDDASGSNADLFEHFGVEVARAPAIEPTPAVEAGPCRGCGWLLEVRRGDTPCPMCGDATPLKVAKSP